MRSTKCSCLPNFFLKMEPIAGRIANRERNLPYTSEQSARSDAHARYPRLACSSQVIATAAECAAPVSGPCNNFSETPCRNTTIRRDGYANRGRRSTTCWQFRKHSNSHDRGAPLIKIQAAYLAARNPKLAFALGGCGRFVAGQH